MIFSRRNPFVLLAAFSLSGTVATARGDEPLSDRTAPPETVVSPESGIVARRSRPPTSTNGQPISNQSPARVEPWTLVLLTLGFVGVLFALRRWRRGTGPWTASRTVQVLSRTPLSGRQSLCLVRVGRNVLLLGVTPDHVRTLTEITEPLEASELIGAAESAKAGSLAGQFKESLGRADKPFTADTERPDSDESADDSTNEEVRRRVRSLADQLRAYAARPAQ